MERDYYDLYLDTGKFFAVWVEESDVTGIYVDPNDRVGFSNDYPREIIHIPWHRVRSSVLRPDDKGPGYKYTSWTAGELIGFSPADTRAGSKKFMVEALRGEHEGYGAPK